MSWPGDDHVEPRKWHNAYTNTVRPDGAIVEVWESPCRLCHFVSGMATVRFPDGTFVTRLGAGCRTRRDRKTVEKWAANVAQEVEP